MIKNRVGRFYIIKDLVDNHHGEIVEMFHVLKILVVRAEMQYASDSVEYIGISPNFDEVEHGYIVPLYYIHAETNTETPGQYKYKIDKQ